MKKTISLILSLIIICGLFTSCGTSQTQSGDNLKIIATVFPEYDWIKNILGEKADDTQLTLLLDNGIDLHSYQPTADDLIEISACDVFVYVGGESDGWVDGALAQAVNKDMIVINLLDVLGDRVREEEIKEGMQAEEEEDREAEEDEDPEYDEHVWLSLKNAAYICKYIAEKLGEADPASKDVFTSNAAAYIEKLNALDGEYSRAVEGGKVKTLLFGDRFPFRYLVDDYGLDYFAAF
ncbi:MAG: zinc ABC transporter substrate-binding protein, partial [Clostridia bacterium]|nr:zinc ABC transporter substrate-binding protein [Clostridia bacterium]